MLVTTGIFSRTEQNILDMRIIPRGSFTYKINHQYFNLPTQISYFWINFYHIYQISVIETLGCCKVIASAVV